MPRWDAITDALRLSRGMSYKNAMAGLALGGGKSVILADKARTKSPEMLATFGRAVDGLCGRYVTAEDVGMSVKDMVEIPPDAICRRAPGRRRHWRRSRPAHLARRVPRPEGGGRHKLGKDGVAGLHIALQGAGSVATGVALHAAAEGARLSIADLDPAKAKKLADARRRHGRCPELSDPRADVLSPNALGAILDEASIAGAPGSGRGRRRQQPACHAGGRRPPDDARYPLRPRLCNQCRRHHQRLHRILGDGDNNVVRQRIEGIPERLEQIWAESDHRAATGRGR